MTFLDLGMRMSFDDRPETIDKLAEILDHHGCASSHHVMLVTDI